MLYLHNKKEPLCDSFLWSGRRDSNSRQSAWKADTLPTELLPHFIVTLLLNFISNKTNYQVLYCGNAVSALSNTLSTALPVSSVLSSSGEV